MSIETSTRRMRDRSRFTTTAQPTARQVPIPGTDITLTNRQAAVAGGAVGLLVLLAVVSGGERRRGFEITDVGA